MPCLAAALTSEVNPLAVIPFVLLLGMIAAMPFINKHWWEHFYPHVAVALGAISVAYYLFGIQNIERVLHTLHEYVSFLCLVGSLFVVAGGIHITVRGQSTPGINVLFLLFGAVISNLIGTTGASMLLIRPWIRMNKYRITAYHIVFFIFIVSNIGGCLTPIGDPPLFLGFLKGVPFWWVIQHCWQAWAVCLFVVLTIFYLIDIRNFGRAPSTIREEQTAHEEWRFQGLHNLFFLGLILVSVFISQPLFVREGLMLIAALASWFSTTRQVHEANDFSFDPIKEVAWLFAGIFATMIPALDFLARAAQEGKIPLHTEMQYYWMTGMLSGVLDNAPTYLTFLSASFGSYGLSLDQAGDMGTYIAQHDHFLIAISLGAVFFGAMTYIGNGPNFMVKSIAERSKVETPSFFEYVVRYSIPILIPSFFLIGILFFSQWRIF